MEKNSKIFVAGHKGLVGSAIFSELKKQGYKNLVTRARSDLDLLNNEEVQNFFSLEKPEYVFLAAAKVGGILANYEKPAEFIYENLQIQSNVIHAAYLHKVKKLLFLGSSCIYPKNCPQPIKEEYLLSGKLEETNEPYAIAKIAGIKMCQSYNRQYGTDFIAAMPTNLYGANDNFDLKTSHVLPALIRKFSEAVKNSESKVEVWGSGKPRREFLHVDDLAEAVIFLMNNFFPTAEQNLKGEMFVNIGSGKDVSISELVNIVKEVSGFNGKVVWDKTKPDGTYQKLLDCSMINKLGWKHKIGLKDGVKREFKNFVENV